MPSPIRAAWLLVAAAGCSPSPRGPVTATPDAPSSIDATDGPPPVCYEPGVSGNVHPGSSTLDSCAIWNNISVMTGLVTVTRDQSMMTMTFDTAGITYTGTVIGNAVSLSYYKLHDFEDGCLWRATETLIGTLDPASCVLTLAYHYAETVETDNGGCATPCSGNGTFSLDIVPIIE